MTEANRGKPKPVSDRRHDAAASAIFKKMCVIGMDVYQDKNYGR